MKEENMVKRRGGYSKNKDLDVSLILLHQTSGVFGTDLIKIVSFHRFLILYLNFFPSIHKS